MRAVRQITEDTAGRWPVEADTQPEALGSGVKIGAKLFVALHRVLPRIVISVNEERYMRLVFVLVVIQGREPIGCRHQKSFKIILGALLPVFERCERAGIRYPIGDLPKLVAKAVCVHDAI